MTIDEAKACAKCRSIKPRSQFNKDRTRKDGLYSYCKACSTPRYRNSDYHKQYRAANAERIRAHRAEYNKTPGRSAKQNARTLQKRLELRAWSDSLKTAPCTDCGNRYMPYVMEWDHLPGSAKLSDVGKMAANKCSRARILEEIAKCDLVCANCHRERTYRRRMDAGLGRKHELQALTLRGIA